MRILIWHGYLLGGTGSNVYTRALARAWSRAGHDVVVLCQEPHPERYDLGRARVVRPALDGPLPVFVLDRYEDADARLLTALSRGDLDRFVARNAQAVRALGPADLLLCNHVLLGAPVGAASGMPYVVKAHGSELEYAMRGRDDLCAWGRQSMAGAQAVLAGSEHVVGVLEELVSPEPGAVQVVPPGVDIEQLRPRDRAAALADLVVECEHDPPNPASAHDERRPDEGNGERLASFLAGEGKTVLYVGKLSAEKGVALLLEALRSVDARAVVVGFGPARAELEAAAGPDVVFTGPLEHRHLAHLWPLADVSVTPSVFPEAFGMVAAEAAACGSPPLVARHSGLAEVAAGLEAEYPEHLRHLAAFRRGDAADLAGRLGELLGLPDEDWQALSTGARHAAERLWSWDRVATRILDLGTAGDPGAAGHLGTAGDLGTTGDPGTADAAADPVSGQA
ncbi:MAG TPA: glycosyltransferase family 4 protein [Jiangellales bacterium]|nr:glycosyltransferase family 4 protein [Jiangellales bacterium]